jgi:hypothetical protein
MENGIDKMIEELYSCAAECLRCHSACQHEKEKDMLVRCMMLDQDCEDICRLTAQLYERDSENAELFTKLCSDICEKCAEECEKHAHMEHCKKCAEACRHCAETCREHQKVI